MTRRWLVTGAGGMLGTDLVELLRTQPEVEVTALDRQGLDIRDEASVARAVKGFDIVVNAAAWTNVDGAESDEAAALAINGEGVANLARAVAHADAVMIQPSSDYVFSGRADQPYAEDSDTMPINAYGRTKLAGETAVQTQLPDRGYVLRTAWLYGDHGRNFIRTILNLAARQEQLNVVDDQVGQPTWSWALAERIVELGDAALAGQAPAGVYHATSAGQTTWYGLARASFELAGLDPERVRPVTSDLFPTAAKRPGYSVLGHERWSLAGLKPMAHWHEMLVSAKARSRIFG